MPVNKPKITESTKFREFLNELENKMHRGIEEHGESVGNLEDLVRELQNEALDFAGWGFLAWKKARRFAERAKKLESELLTQSK